MSRAFTTLFLHHGMSYTAVVSQHDDSINIYVPDESLHNILLDGKATFHPDQGFKIDYPRLTPAQHLTLSILTSVELPVKETNKSAVAKW